MYILTWLVQLTDCTFAARETERFSVLFPSRSFLVSRDLHLPPSVAISGRADHRLRRLCGRLRGEHGLQQSTSVSADDVRARERRSGLVLPWRGVARPLDRVPLEQRGCCNDRTVIESGCRDFVRGVLFSACCALRRWFVAMLSVSFLCLRAPCFVAFNRFFFFVPHESF